MKYIKLSCLALIIALSSCADFLDINSYFSDELKVDTLFTNSRYIQGYIWQAATRFPQEDRVFQDPPTPGPYATDEAFTMAGTGEYDGMAYVLGERTATYMDNIGVWGSMYKIIRQCNTILARMDEAKDWTVNERNLYFGYTRFLRAYAYYKLVVDYGPVILLGDEILENNEPILYYDRQRNLYDEAVEYICSELEEAAKYMPAKQAMMDFGRPTKGAAYGLIARLRLTAASPLYNGGSAAKVTFGNFKRISDGAHYITQTYDEKKWALAAAAAKHIIGLTSAGEPLYTLFTVKADQNTPALPENVTSDPNYYEEFPVGAAGIDPYRSASEMFTGEAVSAINPEYVWGRSGSAWTEMLRRSFPVSVDGYNECCVTQKVIDAFRMVDGRDIKNSSPDYPYSETGFSDASRTFSGYRLNAGVYNMYINREARFYADVGFSERYWNLSSTTTSGKHDITVTYYYSSSNGKGGSHNNGIHPVTGYVNVKGVHPSDAWSGDNSRRMTKGYGIIRYAEVLLNYAEALNNLTASHSVTFADNQITVARDPAAIKAAIDLVRHRAGLPGITEAEAADPATVQTLLEQERMVEFMHENLRYYDVRRWGIYEKTENEPVMGMNSEGEKDSFYQRVIPNTSRIGARIVDRKMILLPIPRDEVRRMPSFDQNPGWEN
jgi:hypothetical protein